VVTQSVILATFIIVFLSTVSFMIAKNMVQGITPPDTGDGVVAGTIVNVQVDRADILNSLHSLAITEGVLGVLFILLAGALAYLLSSQLTKPIRTLTSRVLALRPGHWQLARSVHSGDEVEVLDAVITDLSLRLRKVYQHQEAEIADRTADLKKQYTLDRAILEGIEQGVVTVDRKGRVLTVNPAAERMLQITMADAVGKDGAALLDIRAHRGTKLTNANPLSDCLQKRREVRSPAGAHWSLQRKDGTMLPVILAVNPLVEEKEMFGAIVVLQDITEERRLDYLKSEFITLASHQLRTPLSAIRWYVELFHEERKTLTANQRTYLKEIDHGLTRMISLLSALLDAAHLEGESLKPNIKPVDVGALTREMTEDCQTLAGEAGMSCTLAAPHGKVMLDTDETLLRIVLQNLISNAVKYSSKGKVIALELKPMRTEMVFIVKDQGVGIPVSEQKRVFQRFFRAQNVRKMDTDGNGLGLYISKSIVDTLNGTINFQSKEGTGTVFTVTFPLKHARKK
jgi:PAS domain S-box-containing protein